MPNKRIDQLPSSNNQINGNDIIPIFSDGKTERMTINELVSFIDSGTTVDTYISGGTYSNGTLTLGRNDGTNLTIGGLSFTGNTSGSCISDIYVSNLHSCSPLYIHADGQLMGSFTQNNGFALETGVNMVIPSGSKLVNSTGDALITEDSTTNRVNSNGIVAESTNYWSSDVYRTTISASTTGGTNYIIEDRVGPEEPAFVGTQRIVTPLGAEEPKFTSSERFGSNDYTKVFSATTSGRTYSVREMLGPDLGDAGLCSQRIVTPLGAEEPKFTSSERYADNGIYTNTLSGSISGVTGTTTFTTKHDFKNGIVSRKASLPCPDGLTCPPYPADMDVTSRYDLNNLTYSNTISGSSSGTTGTTKFTTSYDMINGVEHKVVESNDVGTIVMDIKMDSIESYVDFKANTGVINLSTLSGGDIPLNSSDPLGEDGDIRTNGDWIFIKANGTWKGIQLTTFSFG